MALHTKILIALVLGVAAGAIARLTGFVDTAVWTSTILPLLEFTGGLFIRLITMIVIPLVVASLLLGVASLGDLRKLGRIGGKTVAYYLTTTAVAVTIGLALANWVKPGSRIAAETRDALAAANETQAQASLAQAAAKPGVLEVIRDMVPSNPVASAAEGNLLPLIVFVVIFGAALSLVAQEPRETVLNFFRGINDASMKVIDWVMLLAPYAVFALIASVVGRFGPDVLRSLAIYGAVVIAGLALHAFGTYSTLLVTLARVQPFDFFRRIRAAPLIAFSTSSSNATLPVTMETAEENLGVSKVVSAFVLPLGATINMDGTALYQGVATVFIAQVHGIELGIPQLATIVLTATLASIGTAGVPSAGIIMLILVLQSVGLGAQAAVGIALVLGVDRILDMLRTATNVTGDLTGATIIARSEGDTLLVKPTGRGAAVSRPAA